MLNVIALMGRLTREPELRVTPGGTSKGKCSNPISFAPSKETGFEIPKEKTVKGERQAGAA